MRSLKISVNSKVPHVRQCSDTFQRPRTTSFKHVKIFLLVIEYTNKHKNKTFGIWHFIEEVCPPGTFITSQKLIMPLVDATSCQ